MYAQLDLSRLHEYCIRNKLFLNYNKCKYILFSGNPILCNYPYLLGTHIKHLGVIFDSKLLFSRHIDFTTIKSFSISEFHYMLDEVFHKYELYNFLACIRLQHT